MDWKKANKYIPKELKDDFKMHMQNYIMKAIQTFERKHDLSITEKLEEMENPNDNKFLLREYLKKQLFTKAEKCVKYEEPKYESVNEAIEYCKQALRFIDCERNKSKKYYFDIGKALFEIKETYQSKKAFIEDMEEKLERKKTVIYDYLSFYNVCIGIKQVDLIQCNLKFNEIIKNKKLLFRLTGNSS